MLPELVLPLDQLLSVADDLFGAEPAIRRERDKAQVQMRRFLVHVDNSGDDRAGVLLLLDKVKGVLKIGFDLAALHALEYFRAGRDQGFDHADTVLSGTASGSGDLPLDLGAVLVRGFDQVKVALAAAGVYVGIAGVLLLGALVVGLDAADLRPLVLGEAQDRILCSSHYGSFRFCHTRS
jgi:hypothetical protein